MHGNVTARRVAARRVTARRVTARQLFRVRTLRDGFTLVEILIASAVLTLGLVGVLALFPFAIDSGRKVIEDSNAVVIAQSVAEAIRSGVRNSKGYAKSGDVYFVFNHDGVLDPIPPNPEAARYRDDYFILLPKYKPGRAYSGRDQRIKALREAKTFVYPETDSNKNGRGKSVSADNDGDDMTIRIADEVLRKYRVEGVYELGQELLPTRKEDGYRMRTLVDQEIETLKQYSFAFAIRPSYFDADLSVSNAFVPGNKLYHVTVIVYRGLPMKNPGKSHEVYANPDGSAHEAVYELDFEVSL